MADSNSESGLTDMMDDFDLGDVTDTGYEKDVDLEIIFDGFYHQNMAFVNDKIRLFTDFWMKLYSNCCLQRDYAVEYLNDGKPEEAKTFLEDWSNTCGQPMVPQLIFETAGEPKRKKPSAISMEDDAVLLIQDMKDNYIIGERFHFDVPSVLPKDDVSLAEYETHIQECENCFKTIENYVIQNALIYGAWLSRAFEKFQEDKRMKRVSSSFDDWVNSKCKVKKTRA